MTFDDKTLGAYVDGELDPAIAAVIEATARTDEALAARIAQARKLRSTMSGAFASVLAEAPPERLIKAVASSPKTAQAPKPAQAKVIPFRKPAPPPAPSEPSPPQWSRPVWGAMAACLAIGVAVGVVAPWESKTDTRLAPSPLVITALNGQASGPIAGPVRIGLSFKARDGAYCRTFATGATAGLACRERAGWTVKAAAPTASAGDAAYQTASSQTPAAVLDVVDAMIDGAPLDAQAETRARKRGWR
jgi:hypothetical protein